MASRKEEEANTGDEIGLLTLPRNSSSLTKGHESNQSRSSIEGHKEEEADHEEHDGGEKLREQELTGLARTYSLKSGNQKTGGLLSVNEGEGKNLDPFSPDFDAKAWARAFYNARHNEKDGTARRVAGFAAKNLNVGGFGVGIDYQMSVGNSPLKLLGTAVNVIRQRAGKAERVKILRDVDALVFPGEQLCVLGPPGSGCSTFLKSVSGNTYGLDVDKDSYLNYHGITTKQMAHEFRGEAIYTAEIDHHLPAFTVGDTLYFAAMARAPRTIPGGVSRKEYALHQRDVIMAMFGISHTINTQVGNDFVRGVSGGERKRVTIAEAALSYAPIQCWDNSTRGLDSANAVEFCKTLRTQSDVFGIASCVAIYQAPQAAYDLFDKVTLFYEGRQIYFGRATEARAYFEELGFQCPEAQTTPDFLTSMTSPVERIARPGMEDAVPRTPDDFASCWKHSQTRQTLLAQIEQFANDHPYNGADLQTFQQSMKDDKSRLQRKKSPYTLSYLDQVKLCLWRGMIQLRDQIAVSITSYLLACIQILVIASLFYGIPNDASSFFLRGSFIFIMILLNTFMCIMEIMTLYTKRDTVEKHSRYAFYHPSAEALAAMVTDLPYKITLSISMNVIGYFMADLRREPGPFFFFLLISFSCMMCLSMAFRVIGSMTKTMAQAMVPASALTLAITLYTGFAIPVADMRGWASWIRWLNPVFYAFEALITNELHGRELPCPPDLLVPSGPGYEGTPLSLQTCNAQGSVPGSPMVNGIAYYETAFGYSHQHRWRNWGIIMGFLVALAALHLWLSDVVAAQRSKGEVLVFPRKNLRRKPKARKDDEEHIVSEVPYNMSDQSDVQKTNVQKQSSVFHWENVCYDIMIKGEKRRILDNVDGWIQPGTLTALMGVSGAGKTTLLDVLANRVSTGVITGDMFVDGKQRDESFQRNTGYVQQQDIHLHTSTVREALQFSALLRQPRQYSKQAKLEYVEHIINLLDMGTYADAIVGVPGEGLNVEQRKRLTIGVELVARPKLLIFLDEPTSGLDSQTSWSICNLMEKLTRSGQAILCTIHQPSAMLFQRFDRLLLLGKGGKTIYFGDIGTGSRTLLDYFTRNGGHECPESANPAEYMLEVIGAAPGARTGIDWHATWRNSPEYAEVQKELASLRDLKSSAPDQHDPASYQEFAAPISTQLPVVLNRTFQQYWRSPGYIYAKAQLCVLCAVFIGFSFFRGENTKQGLQNQMFGVFVVLIVLMQLIFQTIPSFVIQRTLYEARERQSKTYAWQAFVLSNVLVEAVWHMLFSVLTFACWYFPLGCYRNAELTDTLHSRNTLIFLLIWITFIWASTFANMIIAGLDAVDLASSLSVFLVFMCYSFCGILASPDAMPHFWIFMYRVNPFTYLVSGFLSTSLGKAPMHCASNEYISLTPPPNQSCTSYMSEFIASNGGMLVESAPGDSACRYCQYTETDQYLATLGAQYSQRWMAFGLLIAYTAFNTCVAVFLYWLLRVPKRKKIKRS